MTGYKLGNAVNRKTTYVVQYRKHIHGILNGWTDYEEFDTEQKAAKVFNAKWAVGYEIRVVRVVHEPSTVAIRQT